MKTTTTEIKATKGSDKAIVVEFITEPTEKDIQNVFNSKDADSIVVMF